METETIKINRTIAEYMGYNVIPYLGNEYKPIYNGNNFAKTVGEQKALWCGLSLEFTGRFVEYVQYPFDRDFSYLIPVIKRIEEQGYVVHIAGIKYQIYKLLDEQNPIISLVCGDLSKKTEMTCDLIISFIEHLNVNQNEL
jgi:hypothetical protein